MLNALFQGMVMGFDSKEDNNDSMEVISNEYDAILLLLTKSLYNGNSILDEVQGS
jgi:hypothetical protein